jgi:hypothetical protein
LILEGVFVATTLPFTIWTARYQNPFVKAKAQSLVPVRITVGHPRFKLGYTLGGSVKELYPAGKLFRIHTRAKFEPAYHAHLDAIGVPQITERLAAISQAHEGRGLVLLCYERVDVKGWCHRQCFSSWWKARTGIEIHELPEAPP